MEEREPTRRNSIPWVLHVTRWGGATPTPAFPTGPKFFLSFPLALLLRNSWWVPSLPEPYRNISNIPDLSF